MRGFHSPGGTPCSTGRGSLEFSVKPGTKNSTHRNLEPLRDFKFSKIQKGKNCIKTGRNVLKMHRLFWDIKSRGGGRAGRKDKFLRWCGDRNDRNAQYIYPWSVLKMKIIYHKELKSCSQDFRWIFKRTNITLDLVDGEEQTKHILCAGFFENI